MAILLNKPVPYAGLRKSHIIPLLVFVIFGFVFFFAPTAQAATLLRPANNLGLVGYWSFNEGTSTLAGDFSGRGNTGTLMGGPTWVAGKLGQALSFNGSSNYVSVDDSAGGFTFPDTTFTVSFWAKTSDSNSSVIISDSNCSSGSGKGWCIRASGPVQALIKNSADSGNTLRSSNTSINDNRWHHVVVVMTTDTITASNNNIQIYVDGSLDQGVLTPGLVYGAVNNFLYIGRRTEGSFFNGAIDEMRIYSRALTAVQVAALYNSGAARFGNSSTLTASSSLASGLVGHWTFDGKDMVPNVRDVSGRGYNAILHNYTSTTTAAGKLGQALNFDGTNDDVLVTPTSPTSAGLLTTTTTIAVWIRPNSVSGEHVIYHTGTLWWVAQNGSLLQWRGELGGIGGGAGFSTNSGQVRVGEWTHVAFVGTTEGLKIYVDGVLKGSTAGSWLTDSGSTFNRMGSTDSRYFDGLMDDLRVYNRELSAAEIKQLYNLGGGKVNASSQTLTQGTSLASGLLSHWTFDGAHTTSTIADISGQNNYGYFYGGATSSAKIIGKLGQALLFDGVNDEIRIFSGPALSTNATIGGWFYWDSSDDVFNENPALLRDNTCGLGWILGFDAAVGNGLNFRAGGSGNLGPVMDRPTLATYKDKWTHFLYTKADTNVIYYINGVERFSVGGVPSTAAALPWHVMTNGSCGAGFIKGKADDVRIYNRALSAAEVLQLYNSGK